MFHSRRSFWVQLSVLWAFGFTIAAMAQFQTRSTLSLPVLIWSVATGDFSHDGRLDVAVACSNQVQIHLGNGDGTFLTSISSHT